jgi:hypothetical protein
MEEMNYNNYVFKEIWQSAYANVTYCEELKMAVCTAKSDYIPINEFKNIFLSVSNYIKEFPISCFLFDKRNLRTFHQPSMEWYFAIWKPEMKMNGITCHFKILPKLEWFEKAVEAGKHEIFQKYGKEILNGIQVTYVETIEASIEKIILPK